MLLLALVVAAAFPFYACQGGPAHNSWYGSGQVNALNAVMHASG